MKNSCLDTRVVPPPIAHRINYNGNKGVVSMGENRVEIPIRGNIKDYIVPPPPMTKEEIDRVLRDFHNAAWTIIENMNKKLREQK